MNIEQSGFYSSTFYSRCTLLLQFCNCTVFYYRTTLAEKLELRVLLPAVESSYAQLLELGEYRAISYLMLLLGDSLTGLCEWKDLQTFLIKCLDFRHEANDPDATAVVEPAIISCIESMVLKMNEKEFRSFYALLNKSVSFYDCKKVPDVLKQRMIAFYK